MFLHILYINFIISAVFDYPATKQILESEDSEIHNLPIGVLLDTLLAKQVVTDAQLKRINKRIKLEGNGMKYFIVNVILPRLGNMREKYKAFLQAMEESVDERFQKMAKTLGKDYYKDFFFNLVSYVYIPCVMHYFHLMYVKRVNFVLSQFFLKNRNC